MRAKLVGSDHFAVVFGADYAVAFAGGLFQAAAIRDRDSASDVFYETCVLKFSRRAGHRYPAGAEHQRDELLRQRQNVAAHSVVGHQQPTGQALFDVMQAIAERGLADLDGEFVDEI